MRRLFTLFILLFATAPVHADNWPAWRGSTGQGFCFEKNLPVKWGGKEGANIKWKVPLKDQGNSTPVIWGDKIFLTQANKGGSVRSLICFARADGKILWQKDIEYKHAEQNWTQDWYANASPAVDEKRVVVSLASAGMYCFDHDGKELWKRTDLGHWEHSFGSGSSPVLYENSVILWCGPNSLPSKDEKPKEPKDKKVKKAQGARNFLIAVEKDTGKTLWEKDETHGSWSTPLITKIDGQDQMLLGFGPDAKSKTDPETNYFKGYDPKTGKELWNCRGLNSFVYASPLFANGIAVQMSGYGGSTMAVKLGGKGDITKDRLWLHPRNDQRVGSGIIVGDHCYVVDHGGAGHCYELKTGDDLWKGVADRVATGNQNWGSMVHAEGRIYILLHNADTVVLKASPKFEIIARNTLPKEQTFSSVAVSNGEIFIRTFRHLYCIAEKK